MKSIIKVKESYIFRRAYKKGKYYVSPFFVLYHLKGRRGVRLGITAGKKLGSAVKRNRAKRVITAAFRECLPYITSGNDFIIVARTGILNIKSTVATIHLKKLLKKAGVYNEVQNNEQNSDLAD